MTHGYYQDRCVAGEMWPFRCLSWSSFCGSPTDIRLERLRHREHERYGERIMPGGDMYETSQEFLDWGSII